MYIETKDTIRIRTQRENRIKIPTVREFIKGLIIKKLRRISESITSYYENDDIVTTSVMKYKGTDNKYPTWLRVGKSVAKYRITPIQLHKIKLEKNTSIKMPNHIIEEIVKN